MIIALNGYAGSGKDSVAEILIRRYGFKRFAFADKVRELAEALDPPLYQSSPADRPQRLHSILEGRGGWDRAKQIPEVREYLQTLGTTIRNVLGADSWLRQFPHPGDTNVVITDMRYQNEMDSLIALNDVNVWFARVDRPGVGPVNGHRSETELANMPFDFVILNNGTLEDLDRAMDDCMRLVKADSGPNIL